MVVRKLPISVVGYLLALPIFEPYSMSFRAQPTHVGHVH